MSRLFPEGEAEGEAPAVNKACRIGLQREEALVWQSAAPRDTATAARFGSDLLATVALA
jgi:hypothetical protein